MALFLAVLICHVLHPRPMRRWSRPGRQTLAAASDDSPALPRWRHRAKVACRRAGCSHILAFVMRTCTECGTNIDHFRAGTTTCGQRCRYARWYRNNLEHAREQGRKTAKRWRRRNPAYKLAWDRAHPEIVAKNCRAFSQRYPHKVRARSSRRRAALLQRTPAWADRARIDAVYAACPTGMEVDHFYPLQGKTVSGLHVHENLQYLTPRQNRSKKNRVY